MNKLQIIRQWQLAELLGVAKSTLYTWQDPHSPQFDKSFPKKIRLGHRSVGWLLKDVELWLQSKSQHNPNH